ncbi:hypothetical protein QJS04_geneDACA021235 [Acorus gramineus]|uniref:DDE Tnp4 domain-containing protein n=1 Tax=Acorus gramineus TaxID=55184 RepID=A0AAV9BSU7_ACOGR|nr:hypothetical protein QJS04_geneDACA021235 [Acorus gramineus]
MCLPCALLTCYLLMSWQGGKELPMIRASCRRPLETLPNCSHCPPPPRKYYLVDAGYTNKRGFLAPYRNVRYWLGDYRGRATPQNKEEVFNQLHSSLRNVIERTFGVWKARFPILKRMASYPFDVQVRIVPATMAIHNFIRKKKLHDSLFEQFQSTTVDEDHSTEQLFPQVRPENDQIEMNRVRDEIASQLVSRR